MRQWLGNNRGLLLSLGLTLLFAAASLWMLYHKGSYLMTLVPLGLLVVWLFVQRLETGLLCMALLTPFAINMALFPGMELSMPVEPMMILFTFIFLFRVLVAKNYDLRLLRHPVSLLLMASLAWMLITTPSACC